MTRKFIYGSNSPFQQTDSIAPNAMTACLAGLDNLLWFYTLPDNQNNVNIYKYNGQNTMISVHPYCAAMGSIPICFDLTNGLFLAIDLISSTMRYMLVSYNANNNTKTTIADITNYMTQAGNLIPVNLFFSDSTLYVLATTTQFNTFAVMSFQYSGSNVAYSGYVHLGTTTSDPVSVVQINFIKGSLWLDTALLYYRRSANKWFYWHAGQIDLIENILI